MSLIMIKWRWKSINSVCILLLWCQMHLRDYSEENQRIRCQPCRWSMFMDSPKLEIPSSTFMRSVSKFLLNMCYLPLVINILYFHLFCTLIVPQLNNDNNSEDKDWIIRGSCWCRTAKSSFGCTRKMDVVRIIRPPWQCGIF